MTTAQTELANLDWLLDHGLSASVRGLIGGRRGRDANLRLERARGLRPRPGFHALLTTPDGAFAWAAPAEVAYERSLCTDAKVRGSFAEAAEYVHQQLVSPVRRSVRLAVEDRWALEGASLGLVSALAYLGKACRRAPALPVFATGTLTASGLVGDVDFVDRKVELALAELGAHEGLILVPTEHDGRFADARVVAVRDVRAASEKAFGVEPLVEAPMRGGFKVWLDGLNHMPSDQALRQLEAIEAPPLTPRDQVRLLLHLGNHQRHLGRTELAQETHARADDLARQSTIDFEVRELLQLERHNTELDLFRFELPIAWLREREARGDFVTSLNALFVRGTLARAHAMSGSPRLAFEARRTLMPLHDEDDQLAAHRPRSLVELALTAAWAGERAAFDAAVVELAASHPDDVQAVWNAQAILRGHLSLGDHQRLVGWFDGRPLPGVLPVDRFRAWTAVERGDHPRCTIVRTVARGLRRAGRSLEAHQIASSVAMPAEGLGGWVAGLCAIEAALALRALGRLADAEQALREARERQRHCSSHASRHHARLIEGDWDAVDEELERVFY